MIMELNAAKETSSGERVTCRLCRRSVDKQLLTLHMQNEHGIRPEATSSSSGAGTSNSGGGIVHVNAESTPPVHEIPASATHTPPQSTYCAVCNKDFITGYFYKMHMHSYHGINLGADEVAAGAELSAAGKMSLERLKSDLMDMSKKMDSAGSGGGSKRPSATPTRSYCEICNKELCNKYFMKTHMLKMHGINLESGAQIGGVTCDICNKELCSKYFLKVHKQNTHGIYDESFGKDGAMDLSMVGSVGGAGVDCHTPVKATPTTATETCPLCHKRFRGSNALKKHLNSEHDEREREEARMQRRQVAASVAPGANLLLNGPCNCYVCGQQFPEIVALQVHMIKSHASHLDMGGSADQDQHPPTDEHPEDKCDADQLNSSQVASHLFDVANAKTFQCSFCDFSTTSLPFFFAHERSHGQFGASPLSQLGQLPSLLSSLINGNAALSNADDNKTLQCPICQHHLPMDLFQHHLLAHQLPSFLQTLIPHGPNPLDDEQDAQEDDSGPLPNVSTSSGGPEATPTKSHTPKAAKRFRCSVCCKKFRTRQLCLSHMLSRHPPPVGRKNPHAVLSASAGIQRCGWSSSPSPPPAFSPPRRTWSCPRCGYATRNPQLFRRHLQQQQCVQVLANDQDLQRLPPYLAIPQGPVEADDFVLQAFLLAQPVDGTMEPEVMDANANASSPSDASAQKRNFIPSVILLPVNRRVSNPLSVTFSLTPA